MQESQQHIFVCPTCKNVKELPQYPKTKFQGWLPHGTILAGITLGTSVYNFLSPLVAHVPAAWLAAPFLLGAYCYLSVRAALVIATDR